MSTLALKISIVHQSITKTIQFYSDKAVQEVLRDIEEKINEKDTAGDFGLYFPFQSKWLTNNRTLEYYDIKTGDLLEYKKKNRPLKIRMMDGTMKTFIIDETLAVSQLVVAVCKKIGISNPDEYSFSIDAPVETSPKTIRKKGTVKGGIEADDTKWLNPDRCLKEQNVGDTEILTLKKKFFFSDQNVDRGDPIQLNLLFVQSKETIISGKHPCTVEEAAQLAAMQAQAQFGNHDADKHRPGFLPLAQFLPPEYVKTRDIEKKIYTEYRRLQGMSELNAKFRYVQLCRSLKTYGVTFYLAKEKIAKKNKLVPVLVGITRENVLRVDYETKEILKVWPLTSLRRWAATPSNFTFDFGDYEDSYYVVETSDGDEISRLIAGYIDIILKKKKEWQKTLDDSEEVAIQEENLGAAQATAMSFVQAKGGVIQETNFAQMGIMKDGSDKMSFSTVNPRHQLQFMSIGKTGGKVGNIPIQKATIYSGAEIQTALIQNVQSGMSFLAAATSELSTTPVIQEVSDDKWRSQTLQGLESTVFAQLVGHVAAACSVINQTSVEPSQMDSTAFAASISILTNNLGQLLLNLKTVASLQSEQSELDFVMDNSKQLAFHTSKLLSSAMPCISGTGSRQELLNAGVAIGKSSSLLMEAMKNDLTPSTVQSRLIELGILIVESVGPLLQSSKECSDQAPDQAKQQEMMALAKLVSQTANQLLSIVKTVAPISSQVMCQNQVDEGAVLMTDALMSLKKSAEVTKNTSAKTVLDQNINSVKEALTNLLLCIRSDSSSPDQQAERRAAPLFQELQLLATGLMSHLNEPVAVIGDVKKLAHLSAGIVSEFKAAAMDCKDPEEANRLKVASRKLGEAMSVLITASKEYAKEPSDVSKKEALRVAVNDLINSIEMAYGFSSKEKLFQDIKSLAKKVVMSTTNVVTAAKASSASNRNQQSQLELSLNAKRSADSLLPLVAAISAFNEHPDNPTRQNELVSATGVLVSVVPGLVNASKSASPFIGDFSAQAQLGIYTQQLSDEVLDLEDVFNLAEKLSADMELDNAIEAMKKLHESYTGMFQSEYFSPNEDFTTIDECVNFSQQGCKTLTTAAPQLVSAATQGNTKYANTAARDVSYATKSLAKGLHYLATKNQGTPQEKLAMIDVAAQLCSHSLFTLAKAKEALTSPNKQELTDASKGLNEYLQYAMDFFPGRRELSAMMRMMVEKIKQTLSNNIRPAVAGETVQGAQLKLQGAATMFNSSLNELLDAMKSGDSMSMAAKAEVLQSAFNELIEASNVLVAQANDEETTMQVFNNLKQVTAAGLKMLGGFKEASMDPNSSDFRTMLNNHSRLVGESVQKFLQTCSQSIPGLAELSQSIQLINNCLSVLGDGLKPFDLKTCSYLDCMGRLNQVSANTEELVKVIGENITTDILQSCQNTVPLAKALTDLTDCHQKMLYILGVLDPDSVAGTPALVDLSKLKDNIDSIASATEKIQEANNAKDFVNVASFVAPVTANVCGMTKEAAGVSDNAAVQSQFQLFTKNIAANTSSFVSCMKMLSKAGIDEVRDGCLSALKKLFDSLKELEAFSSSFKAKDAFISPNAIIVQKPLIELNKAILSHAKDISICLEKYCSYPQDPTPMHLIPAHLQTISSSLGSLLDSLRNNAPGQKECANAIEKISTMNNELDSALIQANLNALRSRSTESHETLCSSVIDSLKSLEQLKTAIMNCSDISQMGTCVTQMSLTFSPFVELVISASATSTERGFQLDSLKSSKELVNSCLSFLWACRQMAANGGPEAKSQLEGCHVLFETSIGKLMKMASQGYSQAEEFNKATESIQSVSLDNASVEGVSYANLLQSMQENSKNLVDVVGKLVGQPKLPDDLAIVAQNVSSTVTFMLQIGSQAISLCDTVESKQVLRECLKETSTSALKLIESLKKCSISNDFSSRQKLSLAALELSSSLSSLSTSLKKGQKGIVMLEDAVKTTQDVIGDIDATLIFALAGQLDGQSSDSFVKYRDSILAGAKNIVESTKMMVSSTLSQEKVGEIGFQASRILLSLKDDIKRASTSITSNDKQMQQMLLNGVKSVAENFLNALNYGDLNGLKESTKALVNSLSELVKLVRQVGDESSRAVRAISNACQDMNDQLCLLDSDAPAQGTALPEEVAALAKSVATTAAQLVSNASSASKQDDLIAGLKTAKKLVEDLVRSGKAVTFNAPADIKENMHSSVKDCVFALTQLLLQIQSSHESNYSADSRLKVQQFAKNVANSVNSVVNSAQALIPGGYVDPNDPNVIAERELLSAAMAIEAAAKKLAQLKPPEKPREANQELNFEEQILEAAKAIANATSALIRSATTTQREIVAHGMSGPTKMYFSDGTWSDGLVSAAKEVAAATQTLCEAANQAVKGNVQHERVIVSARAVASSTAQLLSAASVRTDPNSASLVRLKAAGKSVTHATEELVKAAEQKDQDDEEEDSSVNVKGVAGQKIVEMEAQMDILSLEKHLMKARERLAGIRKGRYGNK